MTRSPATPTLTVGGAEIHSGFLSAERQREIVAAVDQVQARVPAVHLRTRSGRMSVAMTSAGRYGWHSDGGRYSYAERHPSGAAWPPIPAVVLEVWREVTGLARIPDSCLVNRYGEGARMGLHQDRDEADFSWPVVSISLGDDALFRIGGTERRAPTRSVWLKSGDVVVLGGPARLAYHGIDRIRFGSSSLLPGGGRINLTLRVVD